MSSTITLQQPTEPIQQVILRSSDTTTFFASLRNHALLQAYVTTLDSLETHIQDGNDAPAWSHLYHLLVSVGVEKALIEHAKAQVEDEFRIEYPREWAYQLMDQLHASGVDEGVLGQVSHMMQTAHLNDEEGRLNFSLLVCHLISVAEGQEDLIALLEMALPQKYRLDTFLSLYKEYRAQFGIRERTIAVAQRSASQLGANHNQQQDQISCARVSPHQDGQERVSRAASRAKRLAEELLAL